MNISNPVIIAIIRDTSGNFWIGSKSDWVRSRLAAKKFNSPKAAHNYLIKLYNKCNLKLHEALSGGHHHAQLENCAIEEFKISTINTLHTYPFEKL